MVSEGASLFLFLSILVIPKVNKYILFFGLNSFSIDQPLVIFLTSIFFPLSFFSPYLSFLCLNGRKRKWSDFRFREKWNKGCGWSCQERGFSSMWNLWFLQWNQICPQILASSFIFVQRHNYSWCYSEWLNDRNHFFQLIIYIGALTSITFTGCEGHTSTFGKTTIRSKPYLFINSFHSWLIVTRYYNILLSACV